MLARARDMASTADQRTRAAIESMALAISQIAVDAGVVEPEEVAAAADLEGTLAGLASPWPLIAQIHDASIEIAWEPVEGAASYAVRSSPDGGGWDAATFETRSVTGSVRVNPRASGSWTFYVAAYAADGRRSESVASITVEIFAPEEPEMNSTVLLNNVLLRWTRPRSSFAIDRYELWRQAPGEADPVSEGRFFGTFQPFFETVGGTYKYYVRAIDIAGNESPRAELSVEVHKPADYILENQFDIDLSEAAVHAACAWDEAGQKLYLGIDPRTPQAKLAAEGKTGFKGMADDGYPYPLQPAEEGGCELDERSLPALLPSATFHFEYGVDWNADEGSIHPMWKAKGYDAWLDDPAADGLLKYKAEGLTPFTIGAVGSSADFKTSQAQRHGIWLNFQWGPLWNDGNVRSGKTEAQAMALGLQMQRRADDSLIPILGWQGPNGRNLTVWRYGIFDSGNTLFGADEINAAGTGITGGPYSLSANQIRDWRIIMRDSSGATFTGQFPTASEDSTEPYNWDDGIGLRTFLTAARDNSRTVDVAIVDRSKTSLDDLFGIYPSAWTEAASVSLEDVKTVKVGLRVVPPDDKSFVALLWARVRVDVLLGVDSGTAVCLPGDADGTVIPYSTRDDGLSYFLAVRSVVATPISAVEVKAVEFFDRTAANPTGFKVKIFDTAGNRVGGTVSWIAHGIVR